MQASIDERINNLIVAVTLIVCFADAWGKLFGPYEEALSEAVFAAFPVTKRFNPLVNLGAGTVVAAIFTVVAAYFIGDPVVIPADALARFIALVEVARIHEVSKAITETAASRPP